MKIKINGEMRDYHTLWREGQTVKMIDQRRLPHSFEIIDLENHKETADAIRNMVTRGAGAIGCAAGYGMAQAALEAQEKQTENFNKYMTQASKRLKGTRPTAINLFHAVDRCLEAIGSGDLESKVGNVTEEADKIAEEDLNASKKMGEIGSELIQDGYGILTHCNAGALAFIDLGTALAPIRYAHREGKSIHVYVDETRPRCQGARLTAWELQQEKIPYNLIVDNAAGYFMRRGEIDMVIVGADRVCSNGDVANKIGTYERAVIANENNIPFYVAAPEMTFDLETPSGDLVEIEERELSEVTHMWGLDDGGSTKRIRIAGEGANVRNPSFDITPARYITGFITEKGLITPPFDDGIAKKFC